MKTEFFQRSHD